MTTAPFVRFSAQPSAGGLYYAQAGDATQPVNRRVLFLPRGAASAPAATLSLADSWALPGIYVFLGNPLFDEPGFIRRLGWLLERATLRSARLLWILNPNDPLDRWVVAALRMASGTPGQLTIALVSFDFRNYELVAQRGCALKIDDSVPGFTIQAPAGQPGAIFLAAHAGTNVLPLVGGALSIPLVGPSAGCLSFPMTIPAGATPAAIDTLDVGLRLFYDAPAYPGAQFLASQRYPIFDTAQASIELLATLDPLAPLDSARTALAFAAASQPIPSFYRTILDEMIALTPQPGSRLVFAPRPTGLTPSAYDALYLVPDGSFAISVVAPAATTSRLLCGTFGAEYIELSSATPATVTFVAGQPAYASTFKLNGAGDAPDAQAAGARLGAQATTAWALVSSDAVDLTYFAQPHSSILHSPQPGSTLLHFFPVPAGVLPRLAVPAGVPDLRARSFPLLPYAGIQAQDYSAYSRLEVQVVSQQRRQVIYDRGGSGAAPAQQVLRLLGVTPDPSTATAVTPQGLVAQFSADKSSWASLQIAKIGDQALTFQSIGDPLRAALLTNQQFLVISNPNAFRAYFQQHNTIVVDGWEFALDPANWRVHGTILIIKNCDKSLRELVGDTSAWVVGPAFNSSIGGTQKQLQQIIKDADAQAHPDLAYFADTVVSDRHWTGILFLNCLVPLAGLPAELRGLAAGIDAAHFFAHHLGINQTPIVNGVMKDSSLFGLLSYTSPPRGATTERYDFQVLSLKALFRNSLVASFSSQIVVTINTLFGAPATQLSSTNGNTLVLDGAYQQHGTSRTIVFARSVPAQFALADDTLAQVKIDSVRFSTVLDAAGQQADTTLARFAFWGTLRFSSFEQPGLPFDIFSYEALAFSNLHLDMSFKIAAPGVRNFSFDAAQIAFDPTQSTARDDSLARHFPLKITGLITADVSKPPTKLGYMTARVPIATQPLGAPWYGLVFDLNLGTLGALASSAGFTASLALAWSPGKGRKQVFVGLKLPGSSGGRSEIALMGVLKLSMYSIDLIYADGAFLLKLNGIALKIFSKTLPPGGTFDFYLFGDPDQTAGSDAMGWYGAYNKDQAGPVGQNQPNRNAGPPGMPPLPGPTKNTGGGKPPQ